VTLPNFPLGPGTTLTAVGRGEIAALYGRFPPTMRRHHATNVVIRVEPDLATAELSSYFLRSGPFEFGGGLYQAGLRRGQDGWRLHRLRVVSTWTWSLKEARVPDLDVPFGAGAERAGRPVDVRTPPAGPRPGPGSPAG